jgi:hypothetical protein
MFASMLASLQVSFFSSICINIWQTLVQSEHTHVPVAQEFFVEPSHAVP